jgi:hypothetical protein
MAGPRLEMFKFGIYLIVPALTVLYFERPHVFQKFLRERKYIVFPPEGPRPSEDIKASPKQEFTK